MRRSLPGITAAAGALALALTACGGSGTSGSDSSSKSQAEVDPATLKAELTWWDTSDPTNEAPVFKDLIKRFNKKYPNVKIKYQSVPFADAQNKFKTAAEAGEGADVLAHVPKAGEVGGNVPRPRQRERLETEDREHARHQVEHQPAKQGRARIFGDKSIGLDDPGMVAFKRVVEALR